MHSYCIKLVYTVHSCTDRIVSSIGNYILNHMNYVNTGMTCTKITIINTAERVQYNQLQQTKPRLIHSIDTHTRTKIKHTRCSYMGSEWPICDLLQRSHATMWNNNIARSRPGIESVAKLLCHNCSCHTTCVCVRHTNCTGHSVIHVHVRACIYLCQ